MNFFLVFQIEAHSGSVNDLAFSYPNKQLCVVTCGDDRVIKVCFVISLFLM
jgi:WD40 repeat protein